MTFIAPRVADASLHLPGESHPWELIVGMEVHAQVASDSKLFSGAPTEFGAAPNTQVSLVDAGMPGCCRSSTRSVWSRRSGPGLG